MTTTPKSEFERELRAELAAAQKENTRLRDLLQECETVVGKYADRLNLREQQRGSSGPHRRAEGSGLLAGRFGILDTSITLRLKLHRTLSVLRL